MTTRQCMPEKRLSKVGRGKMSTFFRLSISLKKGVMVGKEGGTKLLQGEDDTPRTIEGTFGGTRKRYPF